MAFGRSVCQTPAVFPELVSLPRVINTREGIGQIVLSGGDPLRCETKTPENLLSCHPPGHPETQINPRPTIPEKVPTSLIVCMYRNLFILPQVTPQVECNDVSEEFQIRDIKVLEMRGRGGGEKLVVIMIVSANSRCTMLPPIGGCVQ